MNDGQRKDFAELLTQVYSEYGRDISEFSLNAFWGALRRFDFDAVKHAFSVHYSSPDKGAFAPKPGDLIRIIEGGSGDRGLLAWTKVDKAVRRIGPYQSVVFDDPIIHAVIRDMGGWIQLGNVSERDFEFRGKEFVTRYRGYAETGRTDNFPAKLIGIAESDNTQNNRQVDPPLLVGDQRKAQEVLTNGSDSSGLKISRIKADVKQIVDKGRTA